MVKVKKYTLISIMFLCYYSMAFTLDCNAQAYRDELRQKSERHIKCDTVPQLADSVFGAIKTRLFDSLEVYTPSYFSIKAAYDTMNLDQSDQFVLIKQQYLIHNLYKQHKKLHIAAKKNKINLKFIELVSKDIQYGLHKDGYPFAIVTLHCARNNKKFDIRFVAMKVLDHWYIADELKLTLEDKKVIPKVPFSLEQSN